MAKKIDRVFFAQHFPSGALSGKTLTPPRKQGFDALFDTWESSADHPLSWLAYALATAWHETGGRMQPVREGFAATDAEAYQHVTDYCAAHHKDNYAARHANGNSYYGRGYVQLTHGENYTKMGTHLGMGSALYDHPDDVLQAGLGARILLDGLTEGLFNSAQQTLADYFTAGTSDWFNARALVNGDKNTVQKWTKEIWPPNGRNNGTLVADYGKAFHGALKNSN